MNVSPLAGRRVLVTRTREGASALVDLLHARGAEAVVVPLIATQPLASPDEIVAAAAALAAAPAPRWVAFTSATAVRLTIGAAGATSLRAVHVAAVGQETAAALTRCGVDADLVADVADQEGLAAALTAHGVSGATVWFAAAEGARPELAQKLRAAGAGVTVQSIYRSVLPDDAPRRLAVALDAGLDAVTLTSASTARNFVHALGARTLPAATVVACIGARTADEARAVGLDVTVVAREPSAAGLVAALETVG